jgi:phosphoglycerate kinase
VRSIRRANLKDKIVLLRVDFNVLPLKPREPRILGSLSTIKYLLKKKAKVILLTHLETNDGKMPSVKVLRPYLKKYLPMDKIELFENLRKFKGEKKNDPNFAKKLAAFGDIYVNDAFSASHRKHASLVLLPKLLPSFYGFLFEEEIKNLSVVFHPPHPFVLILGGGKVETKLPLLKAVLGKVDKVLLGGNLVNSAKAERIIKSKKVVLPEVLIHEGKKVVDVLPSENGEWGRNIKKAKLIIWNGPLGYVEKGHDKGTKKLISLLNKTKAKVIVGGGDTTDCLPRKISKNLFISTGGGAMLDFLVEKTLPGIRALK